METENGNWKWKLEMEMGTTNAPITFTSRTSSAVLCHSSRILVSSGYMTGFMSHVLCLCSCTVLCDYLFRTSACVASNVAIQYDSRMRTSGHKTSCNLTMKVSWIEASIRPPLPVQIACSM